MDQNGSAEKKIKSRRIRLSIGLKIVLGVLALAVLISSVALSVGWTVLRNMQIKDYKEDTWKLARSIAVLMDGADTTEHINRVQKIYESIPKDFLDSYDSYVESRQEAFDRDDMETADKYLDRIVESQAQYSAYFADVFTDDFLQAESLLVPLTIENDISVIMIVFPDTERKKLIDVFFAYRPEDGEIVPERSAGSFSDYFDGFEEYLNSNSTGQFSINFGDPMKKGTVFLSAAPYYHPDTREIIGYVVVADLWDEVVENSRSFFLIFLLCVLLVTILLIIIVYSLSVRVLVNPIRRMSRAAVKYRTAENKIGQTFFRDLDIRTGDEIETLGSAMKDMEAELTEYVNELTAMTADKERLQAELNVAARIQADMLPSVFPPFPDHKEFDIYAVMHPAREVGGDFYDFYLIDDDHLALTIADVSGKGVPASLFMVISKTILKNRALTGGKPSEILMATNHLLCEGNDSNMFVTVWLGILTLSTGDLICSNGGHEHPVLRRNGGQFELIVTRHKLMLGVMDGIRYTDEEYHLEPGDSLFLYTDGVPEASSSDDSMYTTDRMTEALNGTAPDASPEEILDEVKKSVDEFVGDAPQFDDLTMLGLVYKGLS